MKKLYLLVFLLQFAIISCEKEKKEFPCPVVVAEEVPVTVKSSFESKYAKSTTDIKKWFKKDNEGYCAYFILNNKKTLAHFKNDGTFLDEKVEGKEGSHDDDDEGCECETDD
ncbi:MAG: hypothetical protein M3004_13545 [Bacteroidota bacterium]|nr:hypothetical protein [Bacteroidota bacterium]